jgi:hypothetical protein
LEPEDRIAALRQVAEELSDATGEALTFVEDLPLDAAVRELEVFEEDLSTCLTAVRHHGPSKLRPVARALRRQRYRVAGELQERHLAWRMEARFGRRFVSALERFILFLLLFFCLMLVVEGPILRYEKERRGLTDLHTGESVIEPIFAWLDLGICLVFLAEFSLKMALARRRGLYLRRNWLTGLVPAIPVGFLLYATQHFMLAEEGDFLVLLRLLRYVRLPRMARWLRLARPILRMARIVVFAIRASDRLVRSLGPLLNRNLLLFERGAVRVREPEYRTRLSALRERFYYRATERLADLPLTCRMDLANTRIDDLTAMLTAPDVGLVPSDVALEGSARREIPLERAIARLLAATPAGISDRIGRNLAHSVTRWCRALDVFGVRRLPLVRDLVAASALPSPFETTARVANRMGLLLNGLLDRIYWIADLYGTVTAPQLVDSMGETMVKGSARPARRLVLIGVAFLVVSYLASFLPALGQLAKVLGEFVGLPLLVLGGICTVFFALGVWMRQIAGEASEFYRQVADAHFITVTKGLKRRLAQPYRELLERRVIEPETQLAGAEGPDGVAAAREAAELIWNDFLDGAPFHPSDTRTTNQLLGNLALVALRDARLGLNRRQRSRLRKLDLVNNRMSLTGPYLWFHFVSRSISQQTAKLIIDYNAFALPVSRAETAEDWEILRYVDWLSRRLKRPAGNLGLPEPFRKRLESIPPTAADRPPIHRKVRHFQGNDFTAIHFLSADPEVEADIRRRYGDPVADLVHRDRCDNIRRVFRTYPFHHWPRERRVLNPLEVYQRHLAGGRVLLLPLTLAWKSLVMIARAAGMLAKVIREVLEPRVGDVTVLEDFDPYAVAVRKIHRMRQPLFLECLGMRATCDPQYLGASPPGFETQAAERRLVQIESDLDALGAPPTLKADFRQLAGERRGQMVDFRRWFARTATGDLPREAARAAAMAYAVDYRQARSRLEATRMLQQAFDRAVAETSGEGRRPGWSPRALWSRWRLGGKMKCLFRQPAFARYAGGFEPVCRQLIYREKGEMLAAMRRLTDGASPGGDPVAEADEILLGVARDPDTWTRQLVVLRTVQTLSLIDLQIYCDLVAELGEYDTRAGVEQE